MLHPLKMQRKICSFMGKLIVVLFSVFSNSCELPSIYPAQITTHAYDFFNPPGGHGGGGDGDHEQSTEAYDRIYM